MPLEYLGGYMCRGSGSCWRYAVLEASLGMGHTPWPSLFEQANLPVNLYLVFYMDDTFGRIANNIS